MRISDWSSDVCSSDLEEERQRLFGGPSGLIVGQFPDGQLMRFRTDGHVATIAGTREGKGVASVIPNLIANPGAVVVLDPKGERSEEHTSELQSLMRTSFAVFCLKKKQNNSTSNNHIYYIH